MLCGTDGADVELEADMDKPHLVFASASAQQRGSRKTSTATLRHMEDVLVQSEAKVGLIQKCKWGLQQSRITGARGQNGTGVQIRG